MRRRLPAREMVEWAVFEDLEPFGEERADRRVSELLCLLTNIYRDRKKWPTEFTLDKFMLRIGDAGPAAPTRRQTVQQQFNVLKAIALAYATPKRKGA